MTTPASDYRPRSNARKMLPPTEFLKGIFDYSKKTGDLTWKDGRRAGYFCKKISDGRKLYAQVQIQFEGRKRLIMVHRVCFVLGGGVDQLIGMIDHANGDIWDNRWSNLRFATPSQNSVNCRRHKDRKHMLPLGVKKNKRGGGYLARVTIGTFRTPELAGEAVRKAYKLFHGEFARFSD